MSFITVLQVKVLRSISEIKRENVVIGQYVGNPEGSGSAKLSYRDDTGVPKGTVRTTC